ncbi:hypothetical protein ABFT80_00755 [Mesorhizobium sp. SB112]|uniref:hypothetical protein n=1 Tax=Mesorhizobium sp. SB112 TaxID=3151853 RepID=UPI003265710E
MEFKIRLTPITRFSMVLDIENRVDSGRVFDEDMRANFIERRAVAEARRDKVFGTLILLEAGLAFVVTGSNIVIPYFNIETSKIPSVVEIFTVLASLSLFFAISSFNNYMIYDQIVGWFARNKAKDTLVDPDFLIASSTQYDFFEKMLRKQFHISGADFFVSGSNFKIVSNVTMLLCLVLFLLFPLMHFVLVAYSLSITFSVHGLSFGYACYYSIIALTNALAFVLAVLPWIEFEFTTNTDIRPTLESRASKFRGQ